MSSREFHRRARSGALASEPLEATALHCHLVGRGIKDWPLVVVDELANGNYLIWTLCARLAESGLDPEWTQKFNSQHRSQWVQTQGIVKQTEPANRAKLDIPLPPMLEAVFNYIGRSMTPSSLIIRSTPPGRRPGAEFMQLLLHASNPHRSSAEIFLVKLNETDEDGPSPPGAFSRRAHRRREDEDGPPSPGAFSRRAHRRRD
ncbi:hypothetical protein N7516_003544 [Penicillium verrucosum]|uniref:uncharacterized protein n=1 Tax=Penicillium verrucosum TaxID=60171 RepID=UPI002545411F|nr:uncharacterized protein N7516_003544 [Penicillium verrucosum]KAJ5943376.1 hypothetical protein N7516_003544 [Penicillium verrucosum]